MLRQLKSIYEKEARLVIGLMSGTSKDGVDAALVRLEGSGPETKVELLDFDCFPYDPRLYKRLNNLNTGCTLQDISDLNFIVGAVFADAALSIIEKSGLSKTDIDLIGSHGQTVFHNPPSRGAGVASTLQIGEPDVIAEMTGITTVADFRTRDIAAGGEAAPLVPYVDYILFGGINKPRIAQNLGGIGNATVITKRLDEVMAFDTGPCNSLMDKIVSIATDGHERFDRDGALASAGACDPSLLQELLSNPYFEKTPPKSTGEELFGADMARHLYSMVENRKITLNNLLATVLELSVESIALSYTRFVTPSWDVHDVIFSGGGCDNPFLMTRLRERLRPLKCVLSDVYGVPHGAKEAVAFAILANELVSGNCANLPSVTGASHGVPLGKIVPGG